MPQPAPGVKVYIDGFNLYFAMKDKGWRKYYWLDLYKLAIKIVQKAVGLGFVKSGVQVSAVRYFTSRIATSKGNRKKASRQNAYLEAVVEYCRQINANLTISFGAYQIKPHTCGHCQGLISLPIEKMTDVNLATDLLVDAFFNKFDTAIVVSGDSDLTAPVKAIRDLFPSKKVIVAVPPGRWSSELTAVADRFITISKGQLQKSQLPDEVRRKDDHPLSRPALWK